MAANSDSFPTPDPKIIHMFKMYYLVSFWVEATIYGVYFCLFIVALGIMLKKKALDTTASRVFLIGISSMFVIITFQNSINVYRMLGAYGTYDPLTPDVPVAFLLDLRRWDAYAFPVILAILTWMGDILVIYRCFLIWQKNYYVILLPIFLVVVSIATTSVNLWWFRHPASIPWKVMDPMFKITFPLNLVQNILTTGLISYRIFKQYRASRGSGFHINSNVNLVNILRIIVESALIYTLEMFLMTVLYYVNHPSQIIVQHALAPSIGIVFVMIAIRTHLAKNATGSRNQYSGSSVVPTWLSGGADDAHEQLRSGRNMPIITTTTEQHRMDVISPRKSEFGTASPSLRPYTMDKYDTESDSDAVGHMKV